MSGDFNSDFNADFSGGIGSPQSDRLIGNISHGLLVSRQVMLRPSLPRRKEARRGR